MDIQELTIRKEKYQKWFTIGGLAVVGLLVSPVIFLAIQGIVGLAIAGVIGVTCVSFAPVVARKIANAKYNALEAEAVAQIKRVQTAAAENPIETMQNLLRQKRTAFASFKLNVENAVTARDTFKNKVEEFQRKYPARAPEFQKQLERMIDLVQRKKKALADAQKSLDDGGMKLEEMKAYWDMSKTAIELNKAAGMDTGDAFEKLKADTAVDAVFESMNRAFAQLEVAAELDVNSIDSAPTHVAQLGLSESVVLSVNGQQVHSTIKV